MSRFAKSLSGANPAPASRAHGRNRRKKAPGRRRGLSFIQRGIDLPADVDGGLSSKIADPYDDGTFVSGIFDHKLYPQRVAVLVI